MKDIVGGEALSHLILVRAGIESGEASTPTNTTDSIAAARRETDAASIGASETPEAWDRFVAAGERELALTQPASDRAHMPSRETTGGRVAGPEITKDSEGRTVGGASLTAIIVRRTTQTGDDAVRETLGLAS
jgi:hypothetical protein